MWTLVGSWPERRNVAHLQDQYSGYYQMEIRRSEDYAVLDGTGIVIAPYQPLDVMGTIDTNERVAHGYTIVAPSGDGVMDGVAFSIIGRHTAEFEFDSDGIVTPGRTGISFAAGMSDDAIAAQIRDAVNLLTQNVDFGVTAIMANADTNRVDLLNARTSWRCPRQ